MEGICGNYYNFSDINFGLVKRPTSNIVLEKNIKKLIVTAGTVEILNTAEDLKDNLTVVTATDENCGSWTFEMDEEAQASGRIDVLYEYTIKNTGEKDYISKNLAEQFDKLPIKDYLSYLKEKAKNIRDKFKNNGYYEDLGNDLGSYYYTYDDSVIGTEVTEVATHILEMEDYIDKRFTFVETTKTDFEETKESKEAKEEGEKLKINEVEISNIVKNRETIKVSPSENTDFMEIALKTEFSAFQNLTYESNVAQIVRYANAVGRRCEESVPDNANIKEVKEDDEAKAETIEILDT